MCKKFETSITATAIRLLELGSFPAVVVCNNKHRRLWTYREPDIPSVIQIRESPSSYTNAYELLHGKVSSAHPSETQASDWITHPQSHYYSIHEDSVKINDELVLSLLWWKNEKQLLDLSDDCYE